MMALDHPLQAALRKEEEIAVQFVVVWSLFYGNERFA
jgi:hypothetical protein